jgi:large conductance mechanosensitive channel
LAMLEDFKKFAMRGNVIDLAVGVIIGAAFGGIVSSLVGDVIMPIIGAVTGGLDFSNYFLPLSSKVTADSLAEAKKQGAVLAWGNFITIVINFLIIAFVLFFHDQGLPGCRSRKPQSPPSRPPTAGRAAHRDSRPPEKDLSFHAHAPSRQKSMAENKPRTFKVIADNRKARFNYEIGEVVEAGIALTGTEVK